LARDLGVAAAVEFLGTRRDVPELLGRSDLFVFSTTAQEGLGSVLLEALAAGLPVVATDVPACRETLRDGEFGRLVPANDSAALAGAIVAQLAEPPDAAGRGRGREYAAAFSPERMMGQYLRLAGVRPRPTGCARGPRTRPPLDGSHRPATMVKLGR
jgi:glycosyltransferase involved in cell wall biosynthesis